MADRPNRAMAHAAAGVVLVAGALVATACENDRFPSAGSTLPGTSTTTTAATSSTTIPDATTSTSTTPTTTTTTTTTTTPITTTTTTTTPRRPLPDGRPLRVLIVGDSVAMTLAASARTAHEIDGFGDVEVHNVGNLACPVIEEGEWWFADGFELRVPSDCDGPDRYEAEIEEFRPDVVFALFGWTGGGGGQRLPDGSTVAPCQAEFDVRWRAGYQQLVDRLGQLAIVVVSTVAPADIDGEGHEQQTRCLNAVVGQLDALVFDYAEWLCPGYDCSSSSDLRADKVHFTDDDDLRRRVTESILAQVLPIAGYRPAAGR